MKTREQRRVKIQADRDATARLHLRAAQHAYLEGDRHLAEALDLLQKPLP